MEQMFFGPRQRSIKECVDVCVCVFDAPQATEDYKRGLSENNEMYIGI